MTKRDDAIAILLELGYKRVPKSKSPARFRKQVKDTVIQQHVDKDGHVSVFVENPVTKALRPLSGATKS